MKKIMIVLIAMLAIALTAGFALAGDDIDIDINNTNTNNVTATGGNATATQQQTQQQTQEQNQNAFASANNSIVFEDKREYLRPGGYPGFVNPGKATPSEGWELLLLGEFYAVEELKRMSNTFELSDLWIGNWRQRIRVTPIGEPLPEKSRKSEIYFLDYWPTEKPLAEVRVMGEPNWSDKAFAAKAALECFNGFNSTIVAVQAKRHVDDVTKGRSIGGTGASSSGTKGLVAAVGGQFGDNRVVEEEYPEVEARCMSDMPAQVATQKVVEKTVYVERTTPAPKPEPSCDVSEIDRELERLNSKILWCDWPGRNNQGLRFEKGNAKLNKYYCELKNGNKNTQLLDDAIYEYGVAERDYLNGRELASGQSFGEKPRGVKTTTLSEPTELDYKVHYNWALAVRERYGRDAEIPHAQKYKLGELGSKDMPSEQKDMKK